MYGSLSYWTQVLAWATVGTAALALVALILSIVNFVLASESRIRWTVESDLRNSQYYVRIRNDSERWVAHVEYVGSAYNEELDTVMNKSVLPVDIEPGNWLPVVALQYPNNPPIKATIKWRQRRLGSSWTRPTLREVSLFLG